MLSSQVFETLQRWTLVEIATDQRVSFETEFPNISDRVRHSSSFQQRVSFETDNLKIYTYVEGRYRSFYQFNLRGEQIGSPAIKKTEPGVFDSSITDSFYFAESLRFYKHGPQLFVQTSAGQALGRIPAPLTLSAKNVQIQGSHLVILDQQKISIYTVSETALHEVKTLDVQAALQAVAHNPAYNRILRNQDWMFDSSILVGDTGTVLFQLQSQDQRHSIALIALAKSDVIQTLGTANPRYQNKSFGILRKTGDIFTLEHHIQTVERREQYTTVLRLHSAEYTLKKTVELDGYWNVLWSSDHSVILANDGRGLLQAWDHQGVLVGVYKTPRALSHSTVQGTTVLNLGQNAWLVSDSRRPHVYRIFDGLLRLRTQIQGKLVASENSSQFGLFAIIPVERIFNDSLPIYAGISIYNREGQQVIRFPHLAHTWQNFRFTSPEALMMQNKLTQEWLQVHWNNH